MVSIENPATAYGLFPGRFSEPLARAFAEFVRRAEARATGARRRLRAGSADADSGRASRGVRRLRGGSVGALRGSDADAAARRRRAPFGGGGSALRRGHVRRRAGAAGGALHGRSGGGFGRDGQGHQSGRRGGRMRVGQRRRLRTPVAAVAGSAGDRPHGQRRVRRRRGSRGSPHGAGSGGWSGAGPFGAADRRRLVRDVPAVVGAVEPRRRFGRRVRARTRPAESGGVAGSAPADAGSGTFTASASAWCVRAVVTES